jgi:hypothetical protein
MTMAADRTRPGRRLLAGLAAAVTAALTAAGVLLGAPAATADAAPGSAVQCDPQWHRIRATTAGWFTAEHDGYVRAYADEDFQPDSQLFQVCQDLSWAAGYVVLRSYRTGGWLRPDHGLTPYLRADGTGEPGWANAFRLELDERTKTYAVWSAAASRYLDARTDLPGVPVTVTATGEKDRELVEITPEIRIPPL